LILKSAKVVPVIGFPSTTGKSHLPRFKPVNLLHVREGRFPLPLFHGKTPEYMPYAPVNGCIRGVPGVKLINGEFVYEFVSGGIAKWNAGKTC
jgi:hypothetical protein